MLAWLRDLLATPEFTMALLYVALAWLFVCQYAHAFSLSASPLVARVERPPITSGARSMTMMPIGVPKVAYRMPGSRGGEWVDIYNRLTRERIIFMGSEIDDEMANQIIGVLLVRY